MSIDTETLADINKQTSVVITRDDAEVVAREAGRYNGWTNRETWAANLHLTNDEVLYHEAQRIAASDKYGEALEQWVDDMAEDIFGQTHIDMVNRINKNAEIRAMVKEIGSLWRVNWREVHDSLVEEMEAK